MKRQALAVMAVFILSSGSAWAASDTGSGQPNRGERRPPPPEAYKACQGKSEGAKVQMTTPRGETITATCRLLDGKLVAAPEPPGNRMPPPPYDGGSASGPSSTK
jgi:hypothetical protein